MAKSSIFLILASSLLLLDACGGGAPPPPPPPVATHFSVTAPANIPTGTFFSFTVTALDASNNVVPSYSGIVHFTSSDSLAQLPQNSPISSSHAFSAALITAGNQTITATDKAASSLAGGSNAINVGAVAGAFPVEWFGAKGDGKTDDTTAIQNAISAATAAGGGSVLFKVARYFTTGTFVVPTGVVLSGTIEGPFDVAGLNPAATTIAPTLLVTNTGAPFVTLQGLGSGVADLLFHYPNQVKTSASAPTVYPYTIVHNNAVCTKVVRSTVTNAYDFLDIDDPSLSRNMAQDLFIGALHIGIHIDHTFAFTTLHNIHNGVFWDEVENASYPTSIDTWVLNNGTGLVVQRMDALEVHDFFAFSRFAGVLLTDSPDTTLPVGHGWGRVSDIQLHNVQYGVIAYTTTPFGYEFSNLQVAAAPDLGQAAVQLRAGGTYPPYLLINGGSVQGSWALSAFPAPEAGRLTHVNVIGSDLP